MKICNEEDLVEVKNNENGWVFFICFIVMTFPTIISTFCYTYTCKTVDVKSNKSDNAKYINVKHVQ